MITKTVSLNGKWTMFYFKEPPKADRVAEIEAAAVQMLEATVPGNFETDLAAAGVIPAELFCGMATEENRWIEDCDFWYKTTFDAPAVEENAQIFLHFGAVDCLAEYFLNGEKVYESDNAFIEQRFAVTEWMQPGKNTLHVHIRSAMRYAYEQTYNQYLINCSEGGQQTFLRKPAHAFGWDIFPRAVSGGIWRDVALVVEDEYKISDFSYYVKRITRNTATLCFMAQIDAPYDAFKKRVELRVHGQCGEHTFTYTADTHHCKVCRFTVSVPEPRLWWPYGYGAAHVYDLTYELLIDGEVKDRGEMNLGIRTVELVRTESMQQPEHCFTFVVNGVDVMCKGANWVPLDAYHSRDAAKYEKALSLFTDTYCNIVRVWGGGVYEGEPFYDYCDRHGIMVWQDFCIACKAVPIEGPIFENIEREAVWAVKKLRSHPSLILWSGDNEIDEFLASNDKHTGMNTVTRELLPKVVDLHDTKRPYLASSPYITDEQSKSYRYGFDHDADIFPERHLWGARDYFKAAFYANSRAHFVSETGYHGCPSPESVRKIVGADCVFPIYNAQWTLHSSDQHGSAHRVKLMEDQILQLFAFKPENIEDFSLASQISQAEAKKYFIERIRIKKPYTSGIIWWNMLDGWPQMSDAVVDYFFDKKLAYHYIKQAQQPVALLLDEMHDWHYTLVATNDTLQPAEGTYKVYDVQSGQVYAEGSFAVDANANEQVTSIRMLYSDKAFLVIEWQMNGMRYYNHYLCGYPAFDFQAYKRWLAAYRQLLADQCDG